MGLPSADAYSNTHPAVTYVDPSNTASLIYLSAGRRAFDPFPPMRTRPLRKPSVRVLSPYFDLLGVSRLLLHLTDHVGWRCLQAAAQTKDRIHGRHPMAALDERDITHVKARHFSQLLLGDTGVGSESGDDPANNRFQIGVIAWVQARYRNEPGRILPLTIVREMLAPGIPRRYDPVKYFAQRISTLLDLCPNCVLIR